MLSCESALFSLNAVKKEQLCCSFKKFLSAVQRKQLDMYVIIDF